MTCGVNVGLTALLSKNAAFGQAVAVGLTAGAWSGVMQWKNRERLNWQAHRRWFAFTPPGRGEKASLIQRYTKRALQTGLYGTIMSLSFYSTGLNHDLLTTEAGLRLTTMIAASLYTQTAWEALNQEWTEEAIRNDPARTYLYIRRSSLGTLAQAVVNVAANALNIGGVYVGGVHLGTAISGVVGTLGTAAYASRWLPRSRSAAREVRSLLPPRTWVPLAQPIPARSDSPSGS